jgi:flagellar basal-body rod protein FlgF
MINRFAYVSMTGAKASTEQLAVTSNNLANGLTPGFKEVISAFRAVPLRGDGEPFQGNGADTRVFAIDTTPGSNFTAGSVQTTGNPLDGQETYTRNGKFMVDENGTLKVGRDIPVIGTGGLITIPPNATIQIAEDGGVFTQLPGTQFLNQAGKIKLVNPNPNSLQRAEDGFFDLPGTQAPPDATVRVAQGAFEGSNVNPTLAMVQMIDQSRLFDLNFRAVQTADQNARAAIGLVSLSRG